MKTKKKLAKLMLSKETIANLNNSEMKFIVGRGLDPGQGIALTDSCNPCNEQNTEGGFTCGESCH